MRVAVYSIARNEEKHVERWEVSARDADEIVLYDTGSTDGTIEAALDLGINVQEGRIIPFRFDDARNAALACVSEDVDYCISLDLDEVLVDGWRDALEQAHADGIRRPGYTFIWNWVAPGVPGLTFRGERIHHRNGYRWTHPVHEIVRSYRYDIPETQAMIPLTIEHHADPAKSRSQYLGLLEMSVREDPRDDRNAFYYARELMFHGAKEQSVAEFRRYLAMDSAVWPPERAAAYRYIGKITDDEESFLQAVATSPERREPWVDLAEYYYRHEEWEQCLNACLSALSIRVKPMEYLCEADAWSWKPYDLFAVSSYRLGNMQMALSYGRAALRSSSPQERERLERNLFFYERDSDIDGDDGLTVAYEAAEPMETGGSDSARVVLRVGDDGAGTTQVTD